MIEAGEPVGPTSTVDLHRDGQALGNQDRESLSLSSTAGLTWACKLVEGLPPLLSLSTAWQAAEGSHALLWMNSTGLAKPWGARPCKLHPLLHDCPPGVVMLCSIRSGKLCPLFHVWLPQSLPFPGDPGQGSCALLLHNRPKQALKGLG